MKQNTHDKKRQNDKPKDPFGFQDALNLEVLDNMSNEELEELSKILDKSHPLNSNGFYSLNLFKLKKV